MSRRSGIRFANKDMQIAVEAPIGQPPVFDRTGAEFAELFAGLRSI
jgi:hypothetical protein